MILIVGHASDPHVAAVARSLEKQRCGFTVLDSSTATAGGICHSVSRDANISIGISNLRLNECSAVWWRQKPGFVIPGDPLALYDYYFVHREWNHVIDYLGAETSSVFSINDRGR